MTPGAISPVSLGLDGFLTLLLLAALWVGWRLNGKLKALKAGQAGFLKAVADLDLAAGRAEAGLEALRAATLEAHDTLLARIDSARTVQARLDRACEDASAAAARAEAAAARRIERPVERPVERAPEPALAAPRVADVMSDADGDRFAVLRLIESAREEAGATPPPALTLVPKPAPAPAPVDRLAAFVARRREARAG